MADLGERIATCEERLRGLEADMSSVISDARATRHAVRTVEAAVSLRDRLDQATARRERRVFALSGLLLTALNVSVVVIGIVLKGPS